jgi:hypothetical protein
MIYIIVHVPFVQKYLFLIICLRSDFVSKCATPKCHTTDALSLSINTIIIYIFIHYERYSEIPCKSSVVDPDPAFQVNPDTDPDTDPIRILGFDDQ